MVGEKELSGKKRKTHIQENGAPDKDCLLDPGFGAPFSHCTRRAVIALYQARQNHMHQAFTRFLSYYNSYERNFTIYYGIHPIIQETRNE